MLIAFVILGLKLLRQNNCSFHFCPMQLEHSLKAILASWQISLKQVNHNSNFMAQSCKYSAAVLVLSKPSKSAVNSEVFWRIKSLNRCQHSRVMPHTEGMHTCPFLHISTYMAPLVSLHSHSCLKDWRQLFVHTISRKLKNLTSSSSAGNVRNFTVQYFHIFIMLKIKACRYYRNMQLWWILQFKYTFFPCKTYETKPRTLWLHILVKSKLFWTIINGYCLSWLLPISDSDWRILVNYKG